jgi:acyl-CoA thioesterase II
VSFSGVEPASPAGASATCLPVSSPCPYRARAWWGERLLADSTSAIRVEEPDQPPALYFPSADVHFELVRDEGRTVTCPIKGTAELWSIDAPADASAASSTGLTAWHDSEPVRTDGRDILWSFTKPPPELGWLVDFAAFDHDRVRVELVDAGGSDEPRDVTRKRFPNWGDAAQLIDILDVRPEGENRYVSVARGDHRRPVVEGSQMLAQATVAAGRHAPGRRAVSAHMVFMRPADAGEPLQFDVDELSSGKTFTTLTVHVSQHGRRCASGTFLLDDTAPDVVRHAVSPPDVGGPYDSEPHDMSVTGRDIRVVDDAYTDDANAPMGPPVVDAWVRFREVPDDPHLHAGLLAQFAGHMSIAAALRPHEGIGQQDAHRTLSTAINAIAISFHADVRADHWMLYRHLSTFAGAGMTHSECRVHNEDGDLLASFSVDAMVRQFQGSGAVDDRTAL